MFNKTIHSLKSTNRKKMENNSFKVFLTDYVCSLLERSRAEKNTTKIGFDWLIYQLALAHKWTPIRLPFFRQAGDTALKTKTEAEFGVDLSFLLPSQKELYIFVLKDETLTYKNWIKHNFDSDIRRVSAPDLSLQGLESVDSVKIILAYNKDEDQNGIKSYKDLIVTLPRKINDNITLSFERWNLTRIVEEIELHLLSPELLPQHLSEQFRYICSQVKDFNYGTEKWELQLISNWRNFLNVALQGPIDERKLRLIPVALMILTHYRKESPDSYAGWIDMIEWAMLALWSCCQELSDTAKDKKFKEIIIKTWLRFYVFELEKYFLEIEPVLTTEHGFSTGKEGSGISAINDSYLAYWHLGRLGILTIAPQEFIIGEASENEEFISKIVNRSADWIVRLLRNNPAALRPLVDLNHIELFLIWLILGQAGRKKDISEWLSELESRLLIRRAQKNISVPFIESRSRMDLVVEHVVKSRRPQEYTDTSSYLLLMILELCFSLSDDARDQLVTRYYNRIIKGVGDDGKPIAENQINLIGWVPPNDWSERILKGSVWNGIAITTGNLESITEEKKLLQKNIIDFISEVRQKYPSKIRSDIPKSLFILACIKHRSPLPPEFWRETIFPIKEEIGDAPKKAEKSGEPVGVKG